MNILFDGDSITACYDVLTNDDTLIGFPLIIKEKLKCNYQNNAISGQTSTKLVNRLNNNFIPDYFILEIGANDAWEKIKFNINTTSLTFKSNLIKIIEYIKSLNNNVKIIIQTIATSNNGDLLSEINKFNDIIRCLSIKYNLYLFDSYKFLKNLNNNELYFYDDEIHYTNIAHKQIALELLKYIK